MERDLELGDRCLLLEQLEKIFAFAWVTFRDCRLGLWHMMSLPSDVPTLSTFMCCQSIEIKEWAHTC